MKIALLKGNRFNPWHLPAYTRLRGNPEVVAFRAESEIQRYFQERDDGLVQIPIEPIWFDTQQGSQPGRMLRVIQTRYLGREPHIVPFADRLRDFDLVQSWELFTDWTAEAVTARERYGIPLALMVWDNIPFNMERNPGRRERKQRAARAADVFMVHTERSRRTLMVEGIDEDRIRRIDPGLDTERFSPGPPGREALGIDPDEFVLLFVGWFLPRKGIDFLILALRELLHDPATRGMRFRLLMVGSGPGRDRVESLIKRLHLEAYCTFTGSVPYGRMPEYYRAADVFALPSIATPEWQEQFGMSLIEAMACGTPVVSTLSGAIPEITEDCAALVQPNDFLALYEAIRGLALDPVARQTLRDTALARARERFNLVRFADALSEVFEETLGKQSRAR